MRPVAIALLVGCGAAAPAPDEPATACRPATYACSVMAAREGVTARASIQVRTGEASVAEIAGDGVRCSVGLVSRAPEDHALEVTCGETTFALHEPARAFESRDGWSVEATCWYAQAGHHRTDCDSCRAIDYCEGPDVE